MAANPDSLGQESASEPRPRGWHRPRVGGAKDHIYFMRHGFIYTSPWLVTPPTTRCSASILLTADRAAFEVIVGGRPETHRAVVVRPTLERSLRARDVQFLSLQVNPFHPLYRRFRALPPPGYLSLDRDLFAPCDESLSAAFQGTLPAAEATQLLEDLVARTCPYLPPVKRVDRRIEQALALLQERPNYPLTELAALLGLSYDRMSHLFAENVGLPLRSYMLWLKVCTVGSLLGSGMTLTQIALAAGFNDSAHLCNTWQQAFGASPSSFLNKDLLEIHSVGPVGECYRLGAARRAAGHDAPL